MPRTARPSSQEYWRPADPVVARIMRPILTEGLCPNCSTKYSSGARFCHLCGIERNRRPVLVPGSTTGTHPFVLDTIRQRWGLSVPSVLFFVLGIACLVIGSVIGLFYQAENMVQWQAIQFWRVEWLLGAVAAMLAGILLRK
jgi:hypothetical protein